MYAQSKRSAYPQPTKQQGTRSRNPARNGRKSKPILYRLRKICKRYNWARIGAALLILGAAAFTVWARRIYLTAAAIPKQPQKPEPQRQPWSRKAIFSNTAKATR